MFLVSLSIGGNVVCRLLDVFAMPRKRKKEEFPGPMENMMPGNSFPQICVVSVNESVGK
jgi:hypothetical protein